MRNDAAGYGIAARGLHWLSAFCVAMAWLLGQLVDAFGRAWEPTVVFSHVSFGLTVAGLLALRLGWRFADPPPPAEPSRFDPWAARAATAGHWLLYALLLAIPVSGIALTFARGEALPVFGLFEIASPWVRDRAFSRSVKEVHETIANILLIVAMLHAAAALAHHYILRDRTLVRMLPRAE
ncbi:MAG: cytochrome b [Alphaproteobacteria bacterium]|nr:cytochrome b [Alphaproteobacteria bacterium]